MDLYLGGSSQRLVSCRNGSVLRWIQPEIRVPQEWIYTKVGPEKGGLREWIYTKVGPEIRVMQECIYTKVGPDKRVLREWIYTKVGPETKESCGNGSIPRWVLR